MRNGDPEYGQLRLLSPKRRWGNPTALCKNIYDVYELSQGGICGYILYPRAFYDDYQTVEIERAKMYFAVEKCEKKGR